MSLSEALLEAPQAYEQLTRLRGAYAELTRSLRGAYAGRVRPGPARERKERFRGASPSARDGAVRYWEPWR